MNALCFRERNGMLTLLIDASTLPDVPTTSLRSLHRNPDPMIKRVAARDHQAGTLSRFSFELLLYS